MIAIVLFLVLVAVAIALSDCDLTLAYADKYGQKLGEWESHCFDMDHAHAFIQDVSSGHGPGLG